MKRIKVQRPLNIKLKLQLLLTNEIASGERVKQSLKELFEYPDEVLGSGGRTSVFE